jgi:DNA-binding NarL/FixJ family response regulator
MNRARLALVDDHELFRAGLARLLAGCPELELVGEAAEARSAYEVVERTKPDVVLIDVRLPGTDGIAAARELRRRHPSVRVAMLSASADPDLVADALQAGARGYLLKSVSPAICIEGIRAIARGEIFLAPGIAKPPPPTRTRGQPESAYQRLSQREKEIFHLLVAGRANAVVARELCISVKTVESHREHILKKLAVHSIVELVRFAARQGLMVE